MNWIRSNFAYILLVVVAVILITFMLMLQYTILNVGPSESATADLSETTTNIAAVASATPTEAVSNPVVVIEPVVEVTPTDEEVAPTSTLATEVAAPAGAQSAPDPEELLALEMLDATNLTTSEEDEILVQLIKDNPLAIGFIRYSSYLRNQDTLRALRTVAVSSGVAIEPNEDTVASGAYPFSRPLLLYTSASIVQQKSALEGYLGCYLNQIFNEVEGVGYTPPSIAMYREALANFDASCVNCQKSGSTNPLFPEVPACTVDNVLTERLDLTGGTTVYALSDRMIELYHQVGYSGEINIEDIGTSSGFERFCATGDADLVNASRLVKDSEKELCANNGRELIAFPVGLDLVVVVVSRQNSFIEQASFRQMETIFTDALRWSDVDPSWPNELITRAMPNKSRGTFSFFVEMLYAGASSEPEASPEAVAVAQALAPTATAPQAPTVPESVPTATAAPAVSAAPTATEAPADTEVSVATDRPQPFVDYHIGYLEGDRSCTLATEIVQKVLEDQLNRTVATISFDTKAELFAQLNSATVLDRIDFTLCYVEPDDSSFFDRYDNILAKLGLPQRIGERQYQLVIYDALRWVMRREQHCVYTFLTQVALDVDVVEGLTAATWLNEHADLVQSWTICR